MDTFKELNNKVNLIISIILQNNYLLVSSHIIFMNRDKWLLIHSFHRIVKNKYACLNSWKCVKELQNNMHCALFFIYYNAFGGSL